MKTGLSNVYEVRAGLSSFLSKKVVSRRFNSVVFERISFDANPRLFAATRRCTIEAPEMKSLESPTV